MSVATDHVHASALIVGELGLLLRGPSGAGKSALAFALISQARARGDFGRLVGDDRVSIEARSARLIARPHPAIGGLIEARGAGLLSVPHEPACVLHAIVDLFPDSTLPERFPEDAEKFAELRGVALPRRCVAGCGDVAVAQILDFIQLVATK